MNNQVTTLMEAIPGFEGRCIVGIDGLSRSGKTTLSMEMSTYLKERKIPFILIHIDDHIVSREERYGTGYEEWFEYYCIQWDVEWLRQHLFSQLRDAGELRLPFYDKETDVHMNKNIVIPTSCLIIIEGVFLQRQEWRNFFDLIAYVDCPDHIRHDRDAKTSDKSFEQRKNRYYKAEDYYLKTVQPKERAHLILSSSSVQV